MRADNHPGPWRRPWALGRLAPYDIVAQMPYSRIELDPSTQAARRLDESGRPLELGKHGTQRPTQKATQINDDGRVRRDSAQDYDQD